MDERIVLDWLNESVCLSPAELTSFANSLKHNNDLVQALFQIFEEHTKFYNLIEPVSKQLFNFYRSKEFELRLFTLQFLPSLIYLYLNSVAQGNKKGYHSIETLLIGIYNLEVVDDAGQPSVISFRVPSLAQASIYHEPMSLAHVSLTESALRRLEECNTKLISWGPHPQIETLNAQNRLDTVTKLLFIYNRYIGTLNKLSLKYLCKSSSSLASQGFGNANLKPSSPKAEGSKSLKCLRIPMSFQFLLELLSGLYYAVYSEFTELAIQAVDDIYNRSCYECYANVIAVANAIKNSSSVTSIGGEYEGPMGINVALSPATTTVTTINKFMITNASFRTKKLPDDIPIVQKDETNSGDVLKPLTSINEEKEEIGVSLRGNSLKSKDAVSKNLQKLGIGKKLKEKDGKSLSKTVLTGGASADRKPSTLLPLSTFKEKISQRPVAAQNGEYKGESTSDGHSSMASVRPKTLENGSAGNATGSGDGLSIKSSSGYESHSLVTGGIVDSPLTSDDVSVCDSSKNSDETSFSKVSSV